MHLRPRGFIGICCSIKAMAMSTAMVTPVRPTPAEQWTIQDSPGCRIFWNVFTNWRKWSGLSGMPWSGQFTYCNWVTKRFCATCRGLCHYTLLWFSIMPICNFEIPFHIIFVINFFLISYVEWAEFFLEPFIWPIFFIV